MTLRRPPLSALCVLASLTLGTGAAAAPAPPDLIVLKLAPITLPAGEARNVEVDLGGALESGVLYTAELPSVESEPDAVTLGFMVPGESGGGIPLEGRRAAQVERGTPLGLRVVAGRCCGGSEQKPVELLPPPGARTAKGPVWPVRVLVEIAVTPDFQACHRGLMSLLVGLVGGLLTLYAYGMVLQSHFLSPADLARRIEALQWDETGGLRQHTARDVAAGMVKRELTPWRRAWNWLRANPLVFGLPGRAYHETVEVLLLGGRNFDQSRLILHPRRQLHRDLEKHPEQAEGRLFATAVGGTRFFSVPFHGSVGPFELERMRGQELQRQLVWLRGDERLLRKRDETEEKKGFAGWKVRSLGRPQ